MDDWNVADEQHGRVDTAGRSRQHGHIPRIEFGLEVRRHRVGPGAMPRFNLLNDA